MSVCLYVYIYIYIYIYMNTHIHTRMYIIHVHFTRMGGMADSKKSIYTHMHEHIHTRQCRFEKSVLLHAYALTLEPSRATSVCVLKTSVSSSGTKRYACMYVYDGLRQCASCRHQCHLQEPTGTSSVLKKPQHTRMYVCMSSLGTKRYIICVQKTTPRADVSMYLCI
jgi:hypothetical protein